MKKYALLLAGGRGSRMKAELPKQFLEVKGKTVLEHTLEKFKKSLPKLDIIIVLPEFELKRWKEISKDTPYQNLKVAIGGRNRFQSVQAGLSLIPDNSLVAIHDGVRPMVRISTIQNAFKKAEEFGACIPLLKIKDSIRKGNQNDFTPVNRDEFRLVQTPQCFQSQLIKKAYAEQKDQSHFTDDASVFEANGGKLTFIEGNPENIKITYPHDLKVADALLSRS